MAVILESHSPLSGVDQVTTNSGNNNAVLSQHAKTIDYDETLRQFVIGSRIIPCPTKYRSKPFTNSICSSGDKPTTAV